MKKCKNDIQSFNTYAGQTNIKMLVVWLLLFALLPICGYCQSDSRKEFSNVICDYYLPINKNGLSITSFNVTSKIRIERWEKNAQIILDIEKYQGTASNPDPKFKYSYNYMGKQYGDQHVGKDPFESISTENLTYEVMVSYGDKIFGWKKVDGKTNFFGPIEKDAKASGVMVNVRIVGLMFRGTNEIETKIRGLLQGNTTSNSASSNPLNNNSIQANNNNESAQTRNAQQQNQQQQRGTSNLNNYTAGNVGRSNNTGSTSNAKPTTAGQITNMSNTVNVNGENVKVFKQDGKYYMHRENGTVNETSAQAFNSIQNASASNATKRQNAEAAQKAIEVAQALQQKKSNDDYLAKVALQNAKDERTRVLLEGAATLINQWGEKVQAKAEQREREQQQRLNDFNASIQTAANLKEQKKQQVLARKQLIATYKDGKTPLSSEANEASETYYFTYSVKGSVVDNDAPAIYISNVFAAAKYADGTWPFKTNIVENVSKAAKISGLVLLGYYVSESEANRAQQRFVNAASQYGFDVKNIVYTPKKAAVQSDAEVDFWGNPVHSGKSKNNQTEPNSAKKKLDFWGNPIKQ